MVITVIALSTGLSIVALRDSAHAQLEQEASRLAALLDAARIESRATGRLITWRPLNDGGGVNTLAGSTMGVNALRNRSTPSAGIPPSTVLEPRDFVFEPSISSDGAPGAMSGAARSGEAWPTRWLHEGTAAEVLGTPRVILGPEPLIPPQRIRLRLGQQQLTLVTDGLSGFQIEGAP